VTFDQPLYIKAAEIVAASTDLSNVVVRFGDSHLLMSYLGSIGFIMGGSGTEAVWETVYAAGTVTHNADGTRIRPSSAKKRLVLEWKFHRPNHRTRSYATVEIVRRNDAWARNY